MAVPFNEWILGYMRSSLTAASSPLRYRDWSSTNLQHTAQVEVPCNAAHTELMRLAHMSSPGPQCMHNCNSISDCQC